MIAKAKKNLYSAFHQKASGLRVLYAIKGESFEVKEMQGSCALCKFKNKSGWVRQEDIQII